jgi:hypothetical protein
MKLKLEKSMLLSRNLFRIGEKNVKLPVMPDRSKVDAFGKIRDDKLKEVIPSALFQHTRSWSWQLCQKVPGEKGIDRTKHKTLIFTI